MWQFSPPLLIMTNLSPVLGARAPLSPAVAKTLRQTFLVVAAMWAITGVASALTLSLNLSPWVSLAAMVASLVLIFVVSKFRDSPVGLGLLGLFAGLQGLSLGPLLSHHLGMASGPQTVATAAGLTVVAMFATASYVTTTRRDFSAMRGFLIAGLIVLVVASIVGIFVASSTLSVVLGAVGALLFLGFMLHDISDVVHGRQTNYVMAAMDTYLNMVNLFVSLLRLSRD